MEINLKIALFDALVGGHHVSYASFLCSYLVEQNDEVHYYAWRPDPQLEPLTEAGAEVHFLSPNADFKVDGGIFRRMQLLEQANRTYENNAAAIGADIFHNLYLDYGEIAQYFSGWTNKKLTGSRFATLFWPHFLDASHKQLFHPKGLYHWGVRSALDRMLRKKVLAGLFVHTEAHRKQLIESTGNQSRKSQICVIPGPPVDSSIVEISRTDARNRLGLSIDRPVVLFFGGLQIDKGINIFLKAIPLLSDDIVIMLAGVPVDITESDLENTRSRMSEPHRLMDRLGRVDDDNVDTYFSAADAVILPYLPSHVGTSGVLQLAATFAKPVVATNVGQIGPLVRDNGLGLVVKPESPEALAAGVNDVFAQNESWYKHVRSNAKNYRSKNDWRAFGQSVRAAYVSDIEEVPTKE